MDKNYAYVSIFGKKHTSLVTEALGIEPTKEWNVGDKRGSGSTYDFSHWELRASNTEFSCMDEALEELVSYVISNDIDLSKVPEGFEVFISCAGWHKEEGLGFHLKKDLIMSLGKIGVAVDFDLYCHARE